MAGHSKWANIKYRKAGQDILRGKQFTKYIREITSSVRLFGSDPSANPRLRRAIDKALSANMTRDVIDRAIKRASGQDETEILDELRYEGYGPAGVAVMVDCLSNNKNRSAAEVRHAFSKAGASLGVSGEVAYLFRHLGQIILEKSAQDDLYTELAIEHAAEDVLVHDDSIEIISLPEDFDAIYAALVAAKATILHSELSMLPSTTVALDPENSAKILKLIASLEELDDVQNVYTNADFSS